MDRALTELREARARTLAAEEALAQACPSWRVLDAALALAAAPEAAAPLDVAPELEAAGLAVAERDAAACTRCAQPHACPHARVALTAADLSTEPVPFAECPACCASQLRQRASFG